MSRESFQDAPDPLGIFRKFCGRKRLCSFFGSYLRLWQFAHQPLITTTSHGYTLRGGGVWLLVPWYRNVLFWATGLSPSRSRGATGSSFKKASGTTACSIGWCGTFDAQVVWHAGGQHLVMPRSLHAMRTIHDASGSFYRGRRRQAGSEFSHCSGNYSSVLPLWQMTRRRKTKKTKQRKIFRQNGQILKTFSWTMFGAQLLWWCWCATRSWVLMFYSFKRARGYQLSDTHAEYSGCLPVLNGLVPGTDEQGALGGRNRDDKRADTHGEKRRRNTTGPQQKTQQ